MPTRDNVQASATSHVQRQISPRSQLPTQNRENGPPVIEHPLGAN